MILYFLQKPLSNNACENFVEIMSRLNICWALSIYVYRPVIVLSTVKESYETVVAFAYLKYKEIEAQRG